ncbi:site-2 protease family protein [Candidatus Halobonum tyrrellensis]|uniref:Membrane-associated zn-dependent protease n=1 Tax=Candidatus Halobonum tyrrellensis G22 TaxID=1324957 RepID=V4H9H8_9EURY|nr:site-2 protease family protein [Candidatus Halobonum tyrrellensis]ESP87330.1 membrane-associated zn-dependent protease [Candidatus Halobonum tyrrellensis G22]
MSDADSRDVPRPPELDAVFHLSEVRTDDDRILYYGVSELRERELVRRVWSAFRERGYEVQAARTDSGLDVVVARPYSNGLDGVPWVNLGLFAATVLSTLLVGAFAWYYVPLAEIQRNPLTVLRAWPFTAAVLGVLMTHELGHYVMGRYHGVDVSLPYVIPFFIPFGTMGAVIRMRGQMPDREALFDIGVAGPLAGLAATVVVSVVGLSLGPMTVPPEVLSAGGRVIVFDNPPLLDAIAGLLNQPTGYEDPAKTAHPVIMGAWVGMFFTVLNLLPVGQLDGGHIVRAMVGERQETLAALVPLALFGLAAYLHYGRGLGVNDSVGLWAFWGLFSAFIAYRGPAHPIDDSRLGWKRLAVGVFTFALGLSCFMLTPIRVMAA